MLKDSNRIKFLVGSYEDLENMKNLKVNRMFDEKIMDFFGALSKSLMNDSRAKRYADIMSYAFWIRRQSIQNIRGEHKDYENRLGRGVTFHIAPSNVPINFAVSFTSALLAGNGCIVRVSKKWYEQVDIIVDAICKLMDEQYFYMKQYLCLLQYDHDEEITQYLSYMCDIRIIWGGDRTIEHIRRAQIPPRTFEMTFSDRHSIALIDADKYLQMPDEQVAKDFYTDTYYTDQNACSSPRLIAWFGKNVEAARERFWDSIEKTVTEKYEFQPILAIDKLSAICMLASERTAVRKIGDSNYVFRVQIDSLDSELMKYKNGGGYFFEYVAKDIEELEPILGKECQTISCLGIDPQSVYEKVKALGVKGVDRIVPMGKTMELSFKWDGYDMIEAMSRYVHVM